jgi:hypothetical protein
MSKEVVFVEQREHVVNNRKQLRLLFFSRLQNLPVSTKGHRPGRTNSRTSRNQNEDLLASLLLELWCFHYLNVIEVTVVLVISLNSLKIMCLDRNGFMAWERFVWWDEVRFVG